MEETLTCKESCSGVEGLGIAESLKEKNRQFITVKRPFNNQCEKLHVHLKNIYVCRQTITFREIPRSPPRVKLHPDHFISMPLGWVTKVETLRNILGNFLIEDALRIVEEFL